MAAYSNIISEKEVIARTKQQLRLTHTTQYDDYLSLMINEAVLHLDTPSILIKKISKIPVTDLKAKLPCGFQKLLGLRYYSEEANGCIGILYVDRNFLSDCGCETDSSWDPYWNSFQINGGYMHFNSSFEGTEVVLAWMGLNVDEDGRLIIYENYERALSSYACYMFCMQHADVQIYNANVERYGATWRAQKGWIKATDNQANFNDNKVEIQTIVNAMVINPLSIILRE